MQKKIRLIPKAEIGRGFAILDDEKIELHISGVMGVLKVWLIGKENKPIGNLVGGRLSYSGDISPYGGVLITQSGKQMFYGSWQDENTLGEFSPLPDMDWEKITARAYPCVDQRIKTALSTESFFKSFKKYGYYLFGRDGEKLALAIKHMNGDPSPFPGMEAAVEAGEYIYVML